MLQLIQQFFKLESSSGILLLFAALIAILFANSPLGTIYNDFLHLPVSVQVGTFAIGKTLLHWINDGFMAVFFVLVGLEVKRELLEGSLSSYQQAIFPAFAAVGGMVIPALVYVFIAYQDPTLANGWAIPMATDIAFALGIMALLSKQVPLPLKVFLLALAIIDDLGAIVVIALFFSHGLSIQALIFAAIAIMLLIILNRFKVTALCAYMVVGIILWASVLKSGVHATLAGVIIGFCIPLKGEKGETPLEDFEHLLAPWTSFLILPLFAFANAGVSFEGLDFSMMTSPLLLAIALGLIIGKPLGVFGFSYLSIKLGIAKLPEDINFKQIFSVAILCGIGFTMSMFLASLAFDENTGESVNTLSRLGILLGSTFSAIVGYIFLKQATKA
ncbi:Na+/H+ antiporter NhaA [Rodentibacter pneumotropicus]|uniref:Na(+)/H(+) antiporter NhaA n=1 Tax=Rodentibacter pneumotropicus TaxID=758 RepID=A0A4S2PFJ7_9PAST|nr:Na+/H+ antiporter NhaA [Rodentibacter pneumotropicus]THA01785.1 Na+/H+ antiporter NhaA [Rodentibacter pneumotropicus]THA02000.1 Na+/H+ antiporter NhaA [Rodentibacter pneumotropicus]THA06830.1 Na+/H+ antiporter NhaA [Rodentibacter pneumotropicus]THA15010.1 Na+/H+ antiporter NhaA [Rodentibacter pneumotropicus]